MGHQIIQQPDGQFAIWSTYSDSIIMWDATPEEIITSMIEDKREQIEVEVKDTVRKLKRGQKPYAQFTRTWEYCVQRQKEMHGAKDSSMNILNAINQRGK